MANILRKWIESDRRELRRINKIANKVESYADQMAALSDDQLKAKTAEFKKRVQEQGEDLDHLLPEAFAVAREGPSGSWGCTRSTFKSWGELSSMRGTSQK